MANTLSLGSGNWGAKESLLLGYYENGGKFFPETFDVTRATGGTRVNKAGLIETPTEIVSGELITNGDFATDSDWGKLNATISGGKGNLIGDGVTSLLIQNILTNTKTYTATFTVSNYNSIGESNVINDNGDVLFPVTSNGTFTFTFTQSVVSPSFLFKARLGSIYSIDNVSVVEINQKNLARIDYLDDAKGALLTEPQSTNLYAQSSSFVGNWQASNLNLTLSSVLSPNGIDYATKIEQTANYGNYYKGKTVISGSDYTHSIFAKKGNTDWIYLRPIDFDVSADNKVWFDLNNGVVGTDSASVGSIKDYGNGWYRCSVKFNTTTDLTGRVLGYNCNSDGDAIGSVGLTSYIWGAQLEQQSYATSYIPTFNGIVSRNQDEVTNGGSVTNFNSEEGVLYAEIASLSEETPISKYISISDGTYDNRLSIMYSVGATNGIRAFFRIGGVTQADMSFITSDITALHKVAFKYKENDFSLWIDGVEVLTDTSGNTLPPNTLTSLSFSEINTSAGLFFGKTKNAQVFNTALSDSDLLSLTTTGSVPYWTQYSAMATTLNYTNK